MKKQLEKKQSHAFGKDVYLLGKKDGDLLWLESPSWDCDWYWGFGYVEVYTNQENPSCSRDITSHSQVSGLTGKQEYYDTEKQCFRLSSEYIHNLYNAIDEPTFSEKEGWKLSELFEQFYLLNKMAAFCHKEKPGCHITTSLVDHGNMKNWYEKINKEMIPKITEKICNILSEEKPENYQEISYHN